jgi:hypothetical protein
MIGNRIASHLFSQVSDAFDLNSIYRPIQWNAKDVLSDRRKSVIRQKYINLAVWLAASVLFVLMLVLISSIEPKLAVSKTAAPKTTIYSGNQAFARGDYLGAQQQYKEAIQAGLGTNTVWINYDRSLIMKTFQALEANPKVLQPSHSIRQEQGFDVQPVNAKPDSDYMTEEEWQQMQQEAYEWLGC